MDDASMEPRHAESEVKNDQERRTYAVWNAVSDADSSDTDDHENGKRNAEPLSASKIEESDADINEDDRESNAASNTESDRDMVSSSGSSSGDVEIEQKEAHNSSRDLPAGALDSQTLSDEGTDELNIQNSPEYEAFTSEPSATATADDSATRALGDNAEELASTSESINEGDQSAESKRPNTPVDQENEPSSSQSREIAPEVEELEKHSNHDPLETEDEYSKKGFTCGGNPEDIDEEQLREHWMRTLQTSTSTGEIVEEIVKVLKHHQKTHDLLCPVCGSCVTRRVILRKRKRSSLVSVDRWHRDPLDEAETQEPGSTLESAETVEEEATEEYKGTEAYGCLSCFSLFFEKGRQLFRRLNADAGSERFYCLPFFFPPYPWGMTQKRPRSPGEHVQDRPVPETVEEQQPQDKESTCTCGLAQAFIPEFPWGYQSKAEEAAPLSPRDVEAVAQPDICEEVPELPRERRDCTCGLVPALLPDYPWGFLRKDEGAHNIQTETAEEIEGKGADDKRSSCDVVAAVLPSYPWGMMTESPDAPEDGPTIRSRLESIQNVGSAILPLYPWGICSQEQTVHVDTKDDTKIEQVTSYAEQETTIEARITSKTDVYTVTSSKTTYPGERPPQHIKEMVPDKISQTIKHVKLDQAVTIIDASVAVDEGAAIKGPALASLPSTGYANLEEISEEEPPEKQKPEINEPEKPKPIQQSMFPSFQWSVEKLDAGDLKSSLLKESVEPEAETVISVLKPTPDTKKPWSRPWLSIFKLVKPSDKEGITSPLLSATGYTEEVEEVKLPAGQPQTVTTTEAVIDVPPADLGGTTVGTDTSTAAAVAAMPKKEADGWEILKSIVYGGLNISVASLGVTSSAAGGNAITRTVVYMGVATLVSGLIGFCHNVLNLYHYHREHYINVVGVTLLLHGTVALVSFVIFGLLLPLLYAFSYRKTDNRDDKFILCCGVAIVAVTLLSLGKAKVSNKPYIRTVGSYLLGGVLAAIVGYLTGEHVEELLEEWGL